VKRSRFALILVALAVSAPVADAVAAPHSLLLGVTDDAFLSSEASLRESWMERSRSARANLILLNAFWSGIAPAKRDQSFDPADPADSAYEWTAMDDAVRSAVGHGMQPVLTINYAPRWAEGPNRPKGVEAGTWLPDPQQLGLFAQAIAKRYSGHFVDPGAGASGPLPRVRYFEIWAEENLTVHLNPLWDGRRMVAPTHYRRMLNAAYQAIHRVSPGAKVLVGGLSPYGDARPGGRIPPVWFWRSLLCLKGSALRTVGCPDPAHFDIVAHNPINVGGPGRSALSPLDVSTPDIRRITTIVRKAVQTHRVLPAKPKPFWATEIWWDSKPPDPDGVPAHRHARFVTKSLYSLWKQGARAVVWWYIRDQSHKTGFNGTQQSGLFFRDGRPKPAYRAFRFPFIAGRDSGGGLFVWGKAPAPGGVVVERQTAGGWARLARASAGPNQIFEARIGVRGGFKVRARQGGETSLPWPAR
jgi:hypothetical protein